MEKIKDCIIEKRKMSELTSIKIGGEALVIEPVSLEGLACALKELNGSGAAYRVLGNGSNLLVSDRGVEEPVIRIGKSFSSIEIDGEKLALGAGTLLSAAARAACEASLSGMEFAHGIPGSVGGAVRMNAGAYGGEMSGIVTEVEFMDDNASLCRISREEAGFSYRRSAFTDKKYIITKVFVKLKHADRDEILLRMHTLSQRRRDKQPLEFPSAGSAFKRPKEGFAAALIEEAGLKGFSEGGAQISEKHAGFLINRGGASFSDAEAVIKTVREKVFEKSGIWLEPEIEIWKQGEK